MRKRKFILVLFFLLCLGMSSGTASAAGKTGWVKKSNQWYYFGADGKLMKNSWVKWNGEWYFLKADGKMATGWLKAGKNLFNFTGSGAARRGWYNYRGRWYYLNSIGKAQTGWIWSNGKWYYLDQNGVMKTGWIKDKGKLYFLNHPNGDMRTGWKQSGNKWYYLKSDGAMATGWIKDGGRWYYLGRNGVMATGWLKLKEGYYYLRLDGSMVTGQQKINGKGYVFKASGLWDPKAKYTGVDPDKPMVALTFDDGPGPYTNQLLESLNSYGAKATFFLVGTSIPKYPSAVSKMDSYGMEIGNHTYSHAYLTRLGYGGVQNEIAATNNLIRNLTGHGATVMRPPYGAYNNTVLSAAGLPAIYWSIDTRDWETKNTQSTINRVLREVRDGSIILMHDIHAATVSAAIQLIPMLQSRGYQLVTVSEMGKYREGGLYAGALYRNMYP